MPISAYAAVAGLIVIAYFLVKAVGSTASMITSINPNAHQISLAIGVAEGGYDANGNNLANGTLPSANHNPGDLTVDVNGTGSGSNSGFVVYPDDATGYAALDYQVSEWLNGTSANAGPDSTIDQISQFYTATNPAAWAANVATVLGVPSSTPIGQIGNPQQVASTPSASVATGGTVPTAGTVTTATANQSDGQNDQESEA